MRYKTFFANFCNTKTARIIYFFYTQHAITTVHYFFYVIIANGIAKHYKHFIIANNVFSKFNSMTCTLSFILINKMAMKIRVSLLHIILDFFTEITNDKNKF